MQIIDDPQTVAAMQKQFGADAASIAPRNARITAETERLVRERMELTEKRRALEVKGLI